MPAEHDLDPDAMTEAERLAKRRYEAHFAFETRPMNTRSFDELILDVRFGTVDVAHNAADELRRRVAG